MDTKCAAFWKHTNVRQNKKIYPCCRFKESVGEFDGDFSKVLHSEIYTDLRNKSSVNEYIAGCQKCYKEESQGKKSLRQIFNENFETDLVDLEFLEIGFDNICNLSCDPCDPDFSHTWSKKLFPNKVIHIKTIKDELDPPEKIKMIKFLGGEPLMTNRHNKFLSKVRNKNQVRVIYNTNGTFLLKPNDIRLLKEFKSVLFIVSIDGYNELNDRVRKGSVWNDILEFLSQIEQNNFLLEINTVIHLNNWQGLSDLSKFINSRNYKWETNLATYPPELDIVNYKNLKEMKSFFESINFPNKNSTINHLLKKIHD